MSLRCSSHGDMHIYLLKGLVALVGFQSRVNLCKSMASP
jgi:hypothetical protein